MTRGRDGGKRWQRNSNPCTSDGRPDFGLGELLDIFRVFISMLKNFFLIIEGIKGSNDSLVSGVGILFTLINSIFRKRAQTITLFMRIKRTAHDHSRVHHVYVMYDA